MTVIDSPTDLAPPAAPATEISERVSTLPVEVMKAGLGKFVARRKGFRTWLLQQLDEGVHFGVPPGCEMKFDAHGNILMNMRGSQVAIPPTQWRAKPTLYQAGAQMLCEMLRLRPVWTADVDAAKMIGGEGTYVSRCRLIYTGGPFFSDMKPGDVVGESVGAHKLGDKRHDANTTVKIADKRAMVGAVVNALSLADLFTQDLDTLAEPGEAPEQKADAPKVPTRAERKSATALPQDVSDAVARMVQAYQGIYGDGEGWREGLSAFARETLKTGDAPIHWTVQAADSVTAELTREADRA